MVIFSYTGSPQVKISQKVLGGATFFDSHCRFSYVAACSVYILLKCLSFSLFWPFWEAVIYDVMKYRGITVSLWRLFIITHFSIPRIP